MILQDWLKELDYTLIQGNPDTQVEEVIYDSRKAGPGTVFVAMTGTRIDAHCFIPDVLKAGTRILVTERPIDMELEACELDEEEKKKITILRVKDSRRALALLSAARFGYPAKKLTLIGVTGTKGKTTTTHMIKTVLEAAGKKARSDRYHRCCHWRACDSYHEHDPGILRTSQSLCSDGRGRL